MEMAHELLEWIVDAAILLFEYVGIFILLLAGIRGFYEYLTRKDTTRINLARGMAMGLEFKLGSEILRTVIVRDYQEIIIVGGIILLRAALTFLIHWEIKSEELNREATKQEGSKLS